MLSTISSSEPKFFSQDQQEFPSLKKNYLRPSKVLPQPRPKSLHHQDHFYHINKTYLRDFWRHDEEKKNGEYITKMLCESVGRDRASSYSSIFCMEDASHHASSHPPYTVTRWQEVATSFFAYLLVLPDFDPISNSGHLRALVRLKEKAAKQDGELESIIKFYIGTLPL